MAKAKAADPETITVMLANAIRTSEGSHHSPGDTVTLPAAEARELLRSVGTTRA
jgi:hypothetical protein